MPVQGVLERMEVLDDVRIEEMTLAILVDLLPSQELENKHIEYSYESECMHWGLTYHRAFR